MINITPYNNPNPNMVSVSDVPQLNDAEKFYLHDRPEDWLPIPTPQANEFYYLVQFDTEEDDFGIRITGVNLKYSIQNTDGTWGNFIDITSGNDTIITMEYDRTRNITSEGKCQYLFKFVGDIITIIRHCSSIYHISCYYTYGLNRPFYTHNVIEIKINAPNLQLWYIALRKLNYIISYSDMPDMIHAGVTDNTGTVGIFAGLLSLKCIIGFSASSLIYASYNYGDATGFFASCNSLKYISVQLNPEIALMYTSVFSGCNNLKNFDLFSGKIYRWPTLNNTFNGAYNLVYFNENNQYLLDNCINMERAFFGCKFLKKVNLINTPVSTNFNYTFCNCYTLEEVCGLNLSVANYTTSIFDNCYNLKRLIFSPNQNPSPNYNFNISGSYVWTRIGLVEMFNSLPECTTPRTITLGSRSMGAMELSAEDIAIATEKGWNVVI